MTVFPAVILPEPVTARLPFSVDAPSTESVPFMSVAPLMWVAR